MALLKSLFYAQIVTIQKLSWYATLHCLKCLECPYTTVHVAKELQFINQTGSRGKELTNQIITLEQKMQYH